MKSEPPASCLHAAQLFLLLSYLPDLKIFGCVETRIAASQRKLSNLLLPFCLLSATQRQQTSLTQAKFCFKLIFMLSTFACFVAYLRPSTWKEPTSPERERPTGAADRRHLPRLCSQNRCIRLKSATINFAAFAIVGAQNVCCPKMTSLAIGFIYNKTMPLIFLSICHTEHFARGSR